MISTSKLIINFRPFVTRIFFAVRLKVTFSNSVPNKLTYCSNPSHFQQIVKCANVGALETLAIHREQQFLTPVRMKKTKKYETFYKCMKNSLEPSDLGPKPYKLPSRMRWWKWRAFTIEFAIVKWPEKSNTIFGRRIFTTRKCFIFFSFFHSNRRQKLFIPMSCQCF